MATNPWGCCLGECEYLIDKPDVPLHTILQSSVKILECCLAVFLERFAFNSGNLHGNSGSVQNKTYIYENIISHINHRNNNFDKKVRRYHICERKYWTYQVVQTDCKLLLTNCNIGNKGLSVHVILCVLMGYFLCVLIISVVCFCVSVVFVFFFLLFLLVLKIDIYIIFVQERIIEMLVDNGADLDAKTPTGETPLCK
jgi:hypothetical protein